MGKDGDREIGQDQCACDPINRTASGPANRVKSSWPSASHPPEGSGEGYFIYPQRWGTRPKDPVFVNSLFLKKPERIEALGLVLLLALLIWRLMERAMRRHVDSTSTPLPGWDKKATERPTSFMMVTKFAGVIVLKLGTQRQLARPLSGVQRQYLTALDVPATCFTLPAG
jgi:hypothetical protein